MKANRFVWILVCLGIGWLLGGCLPLTGPAAAGNLSDATPTAAPQAMKAIKIGYIPVGAGAPIFVAYEKGYFAEQGLEVTLESFRTGGEMIAPLGLGQLDVGSGEPGTALFNAIAQGLDVKVVLPMTLFHAGHDFAMIAVRADLVEAGVITGAAELKGKKLAVNNLRGMTEYFTNQFLQSGGLSIDDVELVVLPFPEMAQALENGAVDAAYLQHPLAAVALNSGPNGEPPSAVELVRFSDVLDAEQMAVFVYGKNLLLPENRETAVGVTVALIKAFRDLQGDAWRSDPVIVQAFVDYTGQPEDAVRRSVIPYFEPNGILDGTSLLDMQSYYLDRGYTEYSDPLLLEALSVTDFQKEAIRRLGLFE